MNDFDNGTESRATVVTVLGDQTHATTQARTAPGEVLQ